jgi:hypothetical protein
MNIVCLFGGIDGHVSCRLSQSAKQTGILVKTMQKSTKKML